MSWIKNIILCSQYSMLPKYAVSAIFCAVKEKQALIGFQTSVVWFNTNTVYSGAKLLVI